MSENDYIFSYAFMRMLLSDEQWAKMLKSGLIKLNENTNGVHVFDPNIGGILLCIRNNKKILDESIAEFVRDESYFSEKQAGL